LDVDIQEAIKTWFKDGLTSIQKDALSPFHNNDSKPLILKLDKLVNIRDTLFNALPDAYGLNAVQNWSADLVSDYVNKIKRGRTILKRTRLNRAAQSHLWKCGERIWRPGQI
jgi:hypothetical protein